MLNNFIYAKSKAMFEERIAEVPNEAIVFIEDTKEIWTHGTYFDGSTLDPSIIPNLQMEVDELRVSVNDKADVDGSYPDMTVGFAEDLGGAEFTQESEFTIRATADGEIVKDGAARIESIKGNSVAKDGEIIHMTATSIESVGVNQWDEEWELGSINTNTGANVTKSDIIRTKNFIPVIEGRKYYYKCPSSGTAWSFCYDDKYNVVEKHLSSNRTGLASTLYNAEFTVPQGVHYIKFYVVNTYGTTYNHDICINLSDPSINGKYYPHIKRVEDLSIIRKYFPDGMKSAGIAHDEIRYNKESGKWEKVVRIGEVDLGALSYKVSEINNSKETYTVFHTSELNKIAKIPPYRAIANILTLQYLTGTTLSLFDYVLGDKTIMLYTDGTIYVRDTAYTDVESFKATMAGVILYYELATPIITEIEDPGFSYQVWNGGTEQIVASNSAPFKADITYNFSANEWIKQNRFDIEKLNTSLGTPYGVCDTAADTAAKTVAVGGNFSLVTGAQVVVKFTNGNTANTSTLNVNSTGSKTIAWGFYSGAWYMNMGEILTFVYDGTNWYCKSSSAALTSGNVNMGYNLQTINSETCGLAISAGNSIMDSADGALYINKGNSSGNNAIYCNGGNIVTATGAVQGNIVHNTRTITATTTLDAKDNIVLCNNSSAISVHIKMDRVLPGQVFTIIKSTTTNVTVTTLNPATGTAVPYLRVISTSITSASSHTLSEIGVWNLYCIGDYIYLYKL